MWLWRTGWIPQLLQVASISTSVGMDSRSEGFSEASTYFVRSSSKVVSETRTGSGIGA